ncbi:MAG: cohesin domain-containing protein [Desulfococcaceae bacterium]
MKDFCRIIKGIVWILPVFAVMCGAAWGTEIIIPAAEARAGQSVRIPIMIDKTDNLAGVKLSITFDNHLLTFRKADKTEYTSSLMHIVNDKNPGVLIIVMAGAKGVKGENFPIFFMEFTVSSDIKEKKTAKIEVKESQLMSDTLKDAEHKVSVHPLTLLPAEAGETSDKSPAASSEAGILKTADEKALSPASADQKSTDIGVQKSQTAPSATEQTGPSPNPAQETPKPQKKDQNVPAKSN